MTFKTIGELCTVTKGATGISKAIPGDYPLVVTSEERKSHNEYQFDAKAVIVPLVSSTGHGHASLKRIHYQEGKFALGSILCAIIPKSESSLLAEFLYHYLNLNKERELVSRMKGMANVTLSIKEIEKINIPILSIEKQEDFIEYYSRVENQSVSISTSITHQLNLIKDLRQAFLREAMQGKLVSNETSDGKTGADLLAEIQAEKARLVKEKKIKKPKPLAPITEEEIPFEIPENWAWCRLDTVCDHIVDCPHSTPKYTEQDYGYYGIDTNCIGYKGNLLKLRNLTKDSYQERIRRIKPQIGDIIYSREGSIGLCYELKEDNVCLGQRVMLFRVSEKINRKFIIHLITADIFKNKLLEKHRGIGAKHINVKDIVNAVVSLPPLEIQERIVSKLDELMSFCDQLKEQVKQSGQINDLLLQQVLREALDAEPQEV